MRDNASVQQVHKALVEQLAYLLLEVASTQPVLARLTEDPVASADAGLTIKQCYGAIVERDTGHVVPQLRALKGDNGSVSQLPKTDWEVLCIGDVLRRVADARRELLSVAEEVSVDTVQELEQICKILHEAVLHDTTQLQAIAKQVRRGV